MRTFVKLMVLLLFLIIVGGIEKYFIILEKRPIIKHYQIIANPHCFESEPRTLLSKPEEI